MQGAVWSSVSWKRGGPCANTHLPIQGNFYVVLLCGVFVCMCVCMWVSLCSSSCQLQKCGICKPRWFLLILLCQCCIVLCTSLCLSCIPPLYLSFLDILTASITPSHHFFWPLSHSFHKEVMRFRSEAVQGLGSSSWLWGVCRECVGSVCVSGGGLQLWGKTSSRYYLSNLSKAPL